MWIKGHFVNDREIEIIVSSGVGEETFLVNCAEGYPRIEMKKNPDIYEVSDDSLYKTAGVLKGAYFEDHGDTVSCTDHLVVRDDKRDYRLGFLDAYTLSFTLSESGNSIVGTPVIEERDLYHIELISSTELPYEVQVDNLSRIGGYGVSISILESELDLILKSSGKLDHSLRVYDLVVGYLEEANKQFSFSYPLEYISLSAKYHDIGYGLKYLHPNHQVAGWLYFKDRHPLLARVCLFHSQGPDMLIKDSYEEYSWILDVKLSLEEYLIISLISKADRLSGPNGELMSHEERLFDIYKRHANNVRVIKFENDNLYNFSVLANMII